MGCNPVYDAPADLRFAEKMAHVPFTVHLASAVDETSSRAPWHVPLAHELEAWGDQRALDGTVAVQQPLIAPLFGGRSELELWAVLAGRGQTRPYDLVRETLRGTLLEMSGHASCGDARGGTIDCVSASGSPVQYPVLAFEHDWKKALRDGVLTGAFARAPRGGGDPDSQGLVLRTEAIASELTKFEPLPLPTRDRLEAVFAVDAKMIDGRHANNTWLQELPDPITKIAWDNAALISPTTARELGVESGDVLRLSRGNESVVIAAWVLPGTADGTLILPLGWGRTKAGRIGNRRGFDVFPLRTTDAMHAASGASRPANGEAPRLRENAAHGLDGGAAARTRGDPRRIPRSPALRRAGGRPPALPALVDGCGLQQRASVGDDQST